MKKVAAFAFWVGVIMLTGSTWLSWGAAAALAFLGLVLTVLGLLAAWATRDE